MNRNDIEEMIWNLLEQENGGVHVSTTDEVRDNNLLGCETSLVKANKSFWLNCNDVNYNMVITAMVAYQYWKQKKTERFNLEVDF